MITRNPVADVKRPKVIRRGAGEQLHVLTAERIATLADEVGNDYRTLVLFAAYTGLRAGEIAGLRVKDVDPLRRRVTVRESVSDVNGHLMVVAPKNGRTGTVPLAKIHQAPHQTGGVRRAAAKAVPGSLHGVGCLADLTRLNELDSPLRQAAGPSPKGSER